MITGQTTPADLLKALDSLPMADLSAATEPQMAAIGWLFLARRMPASRLPPMPALLAGAPRPVLENETTIIPSGAE